MDKLEQYLDQVCRTIGGSRSLRQHVRQELREHLRDAVAEHRAAGLSEEDALKRALQDFGGPEEVRSELEATHGQRLMAVVIDKAMQWKEKTMRAKWLWMTWAFLAVLLLIAMEVLFITFMLISIVPKYQKLLRDGYIEYAVFEEQGVTWMPDFLVSLKDFTGHYTTYLALATAALWLLFEWRVKSENKAYIRLSIFGTVATFLSVILILAAGTMVVSFTLTVPALGQMARPFAREQVATMDTSVRAIEDALAQSDWSTMQERVEQAASAIMRLERGPALTSLTSWKEPGKLDELRAEVKSTHGVLGSMEVAIRAKKVDLVKAELATFHEAFRALKEAAVKAGK